MHVWTWCLGSIGPTAAGAPAVAERQHLQVGDGRVVDDGDVQAQAADQLHRPQAGHVFVASQPSLQKLLVGQQEDGSVPTRDVGRHLEHLDLRLRTAGRDLRWFMTLALFSQCVAVIHHCHSVLIRVYVNLLTLILTHLIIEFKEQRISITVSTWTLIFHQ